MGPFLPMFSLTAEHEFFDDGRLRGVRFVPAVHARDLMHRAGLLIRTVANGIELNYDRSRMEALQLFVEEAGGVLSFPFKAYVDDEAFRNYSESFLSAPDAIPYFDCEGAQAEDDRLRLHAAGKVSPQDLEPIESGTFAELLEGPERLVRPAFAVRVDFPCGRAASLSEALDAAPVRCFVRFGARPTYWTYYLLGPFVDRRVTIVDLDETVVFEPLGSVSLSDAHPALAFRSEAAIPLRQRPACRFQLREAGSGNGRVLVRRLPVAASSRVNRQTIRGKEVSVSEVYVNG